MALFESLGKPFQEIIIWKIRKSPFLPGKPTNFRLRHVQEQTVELPEGIVVFHTHMLQVHGAYGIVFPFCCNNTVTMVYPILGHTPILSFRGKTNLRNLSFECHVVTLPRISDVPITPWLCMCVYMYV